MTAEPISAPLDDGPLPDWFCPPEGGWAEEDPDRLPPSAPRFELIDGALVMRSPQTSFHSRVMRRLANAIELAGCGARVELAAIRCSPPAWRGRSPGR